MLRFLSIKRLAVIDAVDIEFGPGLNVLTGETGAGKSILVEAVGLLIGERASGDLVRTGEESASIEAIFERGAEELLVRRELSSQGRSRAFINGELVTAGALKEATEHLIELHGQHEHHTLLDSSTHVAVLDAFGQLGRSAGRVAAAFALMRGSSEDLARARGTAADRDARRELLSFQLAELERAALKAGEDDQLTATRHVLVSAERLERLCAESYASLYESDDAVLAKLGGVWKRVAELASIDPQFKPFVDARDSIKSQLEDLASSLRRYADGIDVSPARLQQVEERLSLLERLKRKYGPTLDDVRARQERVRMDLDELERSDERIAALQRGHERTHAEYLAEAQALSEARRSLRSEFAQQLESLLGDLAMDRTRFEIRFNVEPLSPSEWTASGIDSVEFFVSPNPGEEVRPLARIASGGELSRIMLAIKTLAATARRGLSEAEERPPGGEAPGLIFDEIDAGIGGRAADMVGRKLRALGSAFQVLCITHLPQIAAYADSHFLIDKRVEGDRTRTRVAGLDRAGRVEELARMLGGEVVTDKLRASAREMLAGVRGDVASRREQKEAPGSRANARNDAARPGGESERAKAKRP